MFCKICEFSRLSGTSVDTLRHYERCGLLRPKIYSANGYRMYTDSGFITLMNIPTACMPLAMTAAAFSIPTRNPMSPAAARLSPGRLPPAVSPALTQWNMSARFSKIFFAQKGRACALPFLVLRCTVSSLDKSLSYL